LFLGTEHLMSATGHRISRVIGMLYASRWRSATRPQEEAEDPMVEPVFSAVDAALGYLYQVRCALLWTLKRQRTETTEFQVSIETLDDVTFEHVGGEPTDLLQTKHHRRGVASLTDASPDLWKTLRIWFEGDRTKTVPASTALYLVTTAKCAEDTAAAFLRHGERDVEQARQLLDDVARTSTNATNLAGYSAFLAATKAQQIAILDRVVIVDRAPSINDLDGALRGEVYWAAGREHLAAFLQRLEGWWFRRVLRQLTDTAGSQRISSMELDAEMSDLREQFRQDALPIDDDLLQFDLDEATAAAHLNSPFVLQLNLIRAAKQRIAAAIRDYYRAFEQRSRWMRDRLLLQTELGKYEKRLLEEWELVFEAMRNELGDDAAEEAKAAAARSVLTWAERTTIPIRASVTEPFVTRGSLHMLADDGRLGWHPEFRSRLADVLGAREHAA